MAHPGLIKINHNQKRKVSLWIDTHTHKPLKKEKDHTNSIWNFLSFYHSSA